MSHLEQFQEKHKDLAMNGITVLLSVYKKENPEYLRQALESIWESQTLKPDQIVLVEDGPLPKELEEEIENSKLIIENSSSTTMTVVKLPVNGGLTKALNEGLKYVAGDLIARMDSDDISEPHRFERQVAYLESHPDVDIISGSLQEFDAEHECLNVRHYPQTHEECVKFIVKACPLAHPSVMMRKRIFDKGLKYDERYRMSQDIKLWYDAVLAGYRLGNIQEVTLFFRREGDVFRRRSRAKAWNEFKIYMNGIYRLKGLFTLSYRYPIARYIFRNLPPSLVKKIYGSKVRNRVLKS